jgi:hypothetical protein
MAPPEHRWFSLTGFSPLRVAYCLCAISVCLLPIHYCNSPCDVSVATGGLGFLIMWLSLGLCFWTPVGTLHRFRPGGLAFAVYVLHALSTH